MNKLHHLQSYFQEFLLNKSDNIKSHIISTDNLSADTRLNIYKESYYSRLEDALASHYPQLKNLIGDEEFHLLHHHYAEKFPSTFTSIRWYGDQLTQIITKPFLKEFAEWEWKIALAFDAADSNILTIEAMATTPPEDWAEMVLKLHPSVSRINLHWNTVTLWQALIENTEAPSPIQTITATHWMIWRNDYMSYYNVLSPEEAYAIDCVIKGHTFGEICDGLCEWKNEEEVGFFAASLLKSWIQSGLILSIGT